MLSKINAPKTSRFQRSITKHFGLSFASTAIFAMAITAGTGANAQGFTDQVYDGGKARVNVSAKTRALSELITGASCRLDTGIGTDIAMADLRKTHDDFNRIIIGLRDGDPALGIPTAERGSRPLKAIAGVLEFWDPIDVATTHMLSGEGTHDDLIVIDETFRSLFDATVLLASDVSGQHTNPQELLQSDAITLNFIGRQRMLLARMSRIMCGLAANDPALGSADEMAETISLFEVSLNALRQGFPDAGISPPPTDAIADALTKTADLWEANKAAFTAAAEGATISAAEVETTLVATKSLNVEVNNALTLYLVSSPGQEGLYRVPLATYANEQLSVWLENEDMIAAINAQNTEHADLSEDQIIALDQDWRAQTDDGGPLITDLLERPVSKWLLDQQDSTAGFVTEVFIMDNKGLNVAQSAATSDYWQGDEAKWQQTYAAEDGALHISEVEFDDSTGFYQTQASMPIVDPATGEKIGAITFGINVQSLL